MEDNVLFVEPRLPSQWLFSLFFQYKKGDMKHFSYLLSSEINDLFF